MKQLCLDLANRARDKDGNKIYSLDYDFQQILTTSQFTITTVYILMSGDSRSGNKKRIKARYTNLRSSIENYPVYLTALPSDYSSENAPYINSKNSIVPFLEYDNKVGNVQGVIYIGNELRNYAPQQLEPIPQPQNARMHQLINELGDSFKESNPALYQSLIEYAKRAEPDVHMPMPTQRNDNPNFGATISTPIDLEDHQSNPHTSAQHIRNAQSFPALMQSTSAQPPAYVPQLDWQTHSHPTTATDAHLTHMLPIYPQRNEDQYRGTTLSDPIDIPERELSPHYFEQHNQNARNFLAPMEGTSGETSAYVPWLGEQTYLNPTTADMAFNTYLKSTTGPPDPTRRVSRNANEVDTNFYNSLSLNSQETPSGEAEHRSEHGHASTDQNVHPHGK